MTLPKRILIALKAHERRQAAERQATSTPMKAGIRPRPLCFNSGVSIEVVRRRLGHASTETTQIYTLLVDKIADTEIRAARRKREARHR